MSNGEKYVCPCQCQQRPRLLANNNVASMVGLEGGGMILLHHKISNNHIVNIFLEGI